MQSEMDKKACFTELLREDEAGVRAFSLLALLKRDWKSAVWICPKLQTTAFQ